MILGELDFEKRGHLTRERGLHSSNSFEKERGDKGRIKEIRVKESRKMFGGDSGREMKTRATKLSQFSFPKGKARHRFFRFVHCSLLKRSLAGKI